MEPAGPGSRRTVAVAVVVTLVGYVALSAVAIATGLVLTRLVSFGVVGAWDDEASRWLAARRTAPLDTATRIATYFANTEGIVAVAAVSVIVMARRRNHRHAAMVVLALVIELAAFLTTTFTVQRPRPDVERLNSTPATYSFPSGHTAATVAIYGALFVAFVPVRFRRIGTLVVVVLASLVAFARVYRGMHHVTDVIAGTVLGAGALAVAYLACCRSGSGVWRCAHGVRRSTPRACLGGTAGQAR